MSSTRTRHGLPKVDPPGTKPPRRGRSGERPATRAGASEPASAVHAKVSDAVPSGWLEQLLGAAVRLPLEGGERAVVASLVDAVSALLPDYAIGACFVPGPGAAAHGQQVVTRVPRGVAPASAGVDPTRLFPALRHEHVVSVAGSTAGSTLHVASDLDPLASGGPAAQLVVRAADVLGQALGQARRMEAGGTHDDVQALRARLVHADKLATVGQIAAGVVHELNNPLTSIVAYSDYLIRRATVGAVQGGDDVDRLRRISEAANRMLRFTRDFVSYARPSAGHVGPVVLHTIIDQAVAFCEHVLAAGGVVVERAYGADVLAVRGVGEQLVQVFVNLLTNATQAMPAGGGRVGVTTSLAPCGRFVSVSVEDSGDGIAPEHLERVFLPFFTTKGERQGTGLGLSIVKSILDAHEGRILVESAPGHGARFVLELPVWAHK